MIKKSAADHFREYVSHRIELAQQTFETQVQGKNAEALLAQKRSELKSLLPPNKQQILHSLHNAEREREYWLSQAIYLQAFLDTQELSLLLRKEK